MIKHFQIIPFKIYSSRLLQENRLVLRYWIPIMYIVY